MNMTLYHGEPNGPSLTVLATPVRQGAAGRRSCPSISPAANAMRSPSRSEPQVAMSVEGEGPVLVVEARR